MFKRVSPLLIACLVAGPLWAADDPFVGQWKLNQSKSKTVDVMKVGSLGGNKYTFSDDGSGPETIVADGTDQPGVAGTTFSFTIEGPDTWKAVRKKDGRMLIIAIWNLSQDGNTLKDDFTSFGQDGSPSNVKFVYKRATGSGSGFAGTWVETSETGGSDLMLQVRPYQSNGLSFFVPSEDSTLNANLDGKEYPNAAGTSASSSRRVNAHAVEIIYKSKGKIINSRQITLSPDLKTLTMTVHTAGKDEPDVLVFERQL